MKKDSILGITILLLILSSIIFYAATRPSPTATPETAEAPILSGDTYTEKTDAYAITANYATSTPLLAEVGPAADAAAVTLMKHFVSDTIVQFKTYGNFGSASGNTSSTSSRQTLRILYFIAPSKHSVSYVFTTYAETQGVHGNAFFHTFTFDTSTGAPLTLSDLFLPGANYLTALSAIARAQLPAIIGRTADTSFITRGTTLEDKNFSDFFLDNRELIILFPPYAVADYAEGPQTLHIPLTDIANILKPEYR